MKSLGKPLPEQNPLKEMMHTSPFISPEPVLLGVLESSEEYNSEDSLHFCEDERSSSPSIEFEPLPAGTDYAVLNHDRETTSSFHDESLEMEKSWAKEFCEPLTLESNEKDSSNEHGNFTFDIPCKPCSFNATPESAPHKIPWPIVSPSQEVHRERS